MMKKKAAGLLSGLKKTFFGTSSAGAAGCHGNPDDFDDKDDGFDSGEDDDLIVIGKHKNIGNVQSQL